MTSCCNVGGLVDQDYGASSIGSKRICTDQLTVCGVAQAGRLFVPLSGGGFIELGPAGLVVTGPSGNTVITIGPSGISPLPVV